MELKHRFDIDGLRAVAVISVIIYHLNSNWLHGGFVGVDIFFVISGYLVTKIIYTGIQSNTFNFKNFYQRRINRILPAFFLTMFCSSFVTWYLLLPDDFMLFLKSLKTTTYFWENMFFAQNTGGYWDISVEKMPILHTWSLAVEEQFYIILPFLLVFLVGIKSKIKNRLLDFNKTSVLIVLGLIAVVSFCLAQFSPKSIFLTKYNYYSLFTGRAGELLIGSIMGILSIKNEINYSSDECLKSKKTELIIKNILTILGLSAITLSIIFISKDNLFPSFLAMIPTIGVALILFHYDKNTLVVRFLSIKPIVFLGKISYSLYLWHWPVIVLAKKYLFIDSFVSFKQYLSVILTTLSLSILSFYFVETPCRKYEKSFKFSLVMYYLIPTIVIFCVYYVQKETKFLNFIYEKRVVLYKLQKTNVWSVNDRNYCHSSLNDNCLFGDVTKKPEVILIGDSHSGHLFRYFDQAGKKYGFSIRMVEAGGCSFLNQQNNRSEICKNVMSGSSGWIKQSKIIFYIARYNIVKDLMKNSFQSFLSELLKDGKKVIILKDIPALINDNEVDRYFKFYLKGEKIPATKLLSHDEEGNKIVNQIANKNNIIFYNPLEGLTEEQLNQWPIYNGLLAYSDSNHLNAQASESFPKDVLPKQKRFWLGILKFIDNKPTSEN